MTGHSRGVNCLAWLPRKGPSLLCSGSADHTLRLWDTSTGECLRTLRGHAGDVLGVAWSPDASDFASASSDHTIMIWDPESDRPAQVLRGHTFLVSSVSFSADGQFLSSKSGDSTVRLWRRGDWSCVSTIDEVNMYSWPCGIAFHPTDPQVLATLG